MSNRILSVDDDEDDQIIFREALASIDKDVVLWSAGNGEEALRLLKEDNSRIPHFIFLDLNMPRLNGKQWLLEIRKMTELWGVPVIIYSTSTQADNVKETRCLGANYFLVKPNHFAALQKALSEILTGKLKDNIAEGDTSLKNSAT